MAASLHTLSKSKLISAWQCPRRSGYHINADVLEVEIVSGEVVVTHFGMRTMPFIRYRLGDLAALSEKSCSCGRRLPRHGALAARPPLARLPGC